MTKATLVLAGCLLCSGTPAQATYRFEQPGNPAGGPLATAGAQVLLARNGADDRPGDDRGGREGNAGRHRGGGGDGAHHR